MPQGAHWSNDAFTQRHDEITKDFPDVAKCVDDAVLWAGDLASNFKQVCRYLTLCGNNGIVFNAEKFKFGDTKVDFAGFTITEDSVRPSEAYLEGIRNYPAPRDITEARGFFGLVNQASYAFSMQPIMQPFRQLLSPGTPFQWNDKLQKIFDGAKAHIVDMVKEGVKIFDVNKKTCLATDWCRQGIGFFLLQKHCQCPPKISGVNTPTCCKTGWKLVFAGGRFTTPTESRYSPIEGEALAVVMSLYKARYFVLGCQDLTVAVDHLPLLKVFGDRKLEEIENPRLARLKEKALYFNFNMVHVPGRLHKGADAMSRSPHQTWDEEQSQEAEVSMIMDGTSTKEIRLEILRKLYRKESHTGPVIDTANGVTRAILESELKDLDDEQVAEARIGGIEENISAVTWEAIATATKQDPELSTIRKAIETGDHDDIIAVGKVFPEYKRVVDRFSVVQGVVVYKDRAVIPSKLRQTILNILHSAHQGVSSMTRRAERSVFWPGISESIKQVRARCGSCDRVAPSQAAQPPKPPPDPVFPFQQIAADYFSLGGHSYLVIVDRFSNWLSVYPCGPGATAKELIDNLRIHFSTFGICEEFASDGGSQLTAGETKRFLDSWGVKHRLSSSYFAHSNCRAELGVKSAKRLLRENTNYDGSLSNDKFCRALLTYRNTPDPDTKASPAEILFGKAIRDFMPIPPGKYRPQEGWRLTRDEREKALRLRYCRGKEAWSEHTKELKPLQVGEKVLIQNQAGNSKVAKRWDRSGEVIEVGDYDQYLVKVDGSGRITRRNRSFLRKVTPFYSRQSTPQMRESLMSQEVQYQQPEEGDGHQQRVFEGDADREPNEQAQEHDEGAAQHEEVVARELVPPQHHEEPIQTMQVPDQVPDVKTRPQRTRKPNVKYSSQDYDLSRE